jgi:hypothetical protein
MNAVQAVERIKRKFTETGNPASVPLLKGGVFNALMTEQGIRVSNLNTQPFLPWAVFEEAVDLLIRKGGSAERGDAMNSRLGEDNLPVDSIEGHIAHVVYDRSIGDSVFRRITPVACILIWAGVCEHAPAKLILRHFS